VQGVVKSYDPTTGFGVVLCDVDLTDYEMAEGALDGSVFRMLRQGQRVNFELDGDGFAAGLQLGSEVDMGMPAYLDPKGTTQPS
jgi:cold shock CspA family protein